MDDKSKKQDKPHDAGQPDDERHVGLEQVREILFGAAHRDFEQKLGRANAQINVRLHELEQEQRRRTEMLETHLKRETEAVATRIERQHTESSESLRSLTREGRETSAQLEHRMAKLEEANADGLRELRQQLLEQAKAFFDELKDLRKEMLAAIEHELGPAENVLPEAHDEAERRH